MPFMPMEHDKDPRRVIYDKVGMKKLGVIPGFEIGGNSVLIGIYVRPEKTKSGVLLPDQTRKEDENQGKSALVLMCGPTAFKSDANYDFAGFECKPGDWVACWVLEGKKIVINGQLCRLIDDQHLRVKTPAPDSVF